MDTLLRICKALRCNVGDIVDVIEETDQLKITEYPFGNESNLLRVAENTKDVYRGE
jgi:hypothetical protein